MSTLVTCSVDCEKDFRWWQFSWSFVVIGWSLHKNAIFDLEWLPFSSNIVTASGHKVACLVDVCTKKTIEVFRGHSSSLKTIASRKTDPCMITCYLSSQATWQPPASHLLILWLSHFRCLCYGWPRWLYLYLGSKSVEKRWLYSDSKRYKKWTLDWQDKEVFQPVYHRSLLPRRAHACVGCI